MTLGLSHTSRALRKISVPRYQPLLGGIAGSCNAEADPVLSAREARTTGMQGLYIGSDSARYMLSATTKRTIATLNLVYSSKHCIQQNSARIEPTMDRARGC